MKASFRQLYLDEKAAHAETRERYHALAMSLTGLTAPLQVVARSGFEPVEIPEPDLPPAVVLAAMQQISPIKDKTYEANYAYWEKNKARCTLDPEAFAAEIIEGVGP